jgi:hypothetical protein
MSDLPIFSPFEPSDAGLLQAVLYAGGLTDGADLRDVIGLGDGIRDALFTAEELRGGFGRLVAAGFVRSDEGRFFVVGEARGLAKKEGLSLADHQVEIAAFLAVSNYRGSEPEEADPGLSDEKIGEATRAYLALFQGSQEKPESPDVSGSGPANGPKSPDRVH